MAGKHSHDNNVIALRGNLTPPQLIIANIVWLQIVRVDLAEPRRANIAS